MAPIRRYLRITKYSVLEVRIYLEKPSDAPWLLSSRDPVLARIITEIRPKILPKLREENESSKKKSGKKKKGIKDVASQEDFEVVLFLTDSSTRHSLITKQKQFTSKPAITSTSSRLTGWLGERHDQPIDVDEAAEVPVREENSDEEVSLDQIPAASEIQSKHNTVYTIEEDEPASSDNEGRNGQSRRRKGRRADTNMNVDDKKKLAINTSYDGFSIYGKVLCLIVKRKASKKPTADHAITNGQPGASQMMEQWISTQANQEPDLDEND